MDLAVIILAAGKGTRMRSRLPKVLHRLAGKPLVQHVIDTAKQLQPQELVVVAGHGADQLQAAIPDPAVKWAIQEEQLGTGHAVQVAMPQVSAENVLILYGDVPLISVRTLETLTAAVRPGEMALLSVELTNPAGYGRIVRATDGSVQRIVEQKDASAEELAIREGNTGILCATREDLNRYLAGLQNDNAQGEYYLTDCIEACVQSGGVVHGMVAANEAEVSGINNKSQLNELERVYQQQAAERLMEQGVTLADRDRFDLRGEIESVGRDVSIDINCIFEGRVSIGDNVTIGPNCQIIDSTIGDNVTILANCVIENSTIEADCNIGPFARLRPATELKQGAKVGNFVETKKAIVGKGSKVNHLSYVGDAIIGEKVNIGAGTITCNYDGANKHLTEIGDNAFIGSNTALVAPVKINEGATIGAGSTITREAPKDTLTLTRAKQINITGWKRPVKGEKK